MASLRGISKRLNLLQRRVYPFCGHRFGDDKDNTKPVSSPNPSNKRIFRHIGAERLGSVSLEGQYKSFVQPLGFGFSSYRYMSSTPAEFVATKVVSDEILESVTSQVAPAAINEVAIATADSAFPIAAIQHLINAVHSFPGLNWWVDIVLTTFIINGLTLPFRLYETKFFHNILRPQLDQLRQEMWTKASDPETVLKEIRKKEKILYKKYGVNKSTLLKTFVLQCFLFLSFTMATTEIMEITKDKRFFVFCYHVSV